MAQATAGNLEEQPQMAADMDPQQKDQAGGLEELTAAAPATRPDAQTQRYDRQLRLWASSGQASLESANILLIGASHLGAQVLKNLILPGVGSFTILDGQRVTGSHDLGNNFFLEPESIGQSRAQEVARLLAELNPSVKSNAVEADPAQLLSAQPDFFTSFSLLIAVNQPPSFLRRLANLAWQARQGVGIPLMSVRGAGMIGEARVQIKEMGIIETHPASIVDLRITSPWPALAAFADNYDIEDKDAMAHSHIPFVVILLRRLKDWQQSHDGQMPTPSQGRKAFADSINALRDPANVDTENFDEAVAALGQNVWRPVSTGRKVPPEVQQLFEDPACESVSSSSTNFWLLVRALRDFVASDGQGQLPLPGSLPDFKATSATYVEIQRLYKVKAQQDLFALKQNLSAILSSVGLPPDAIADTEVESFAKHAGYLKLVRGRSFAQSLQEPAQDVVAMAFMDPVNPLTVQDHLAFLAVDRFYERVGRFPGSSCSFSQSITGSGPAASTSSSTSSPASKRLANGDTADSHRSGNGPEKKRQRSDSPFPPRSSSSAARGEGDADGDHVMAEADASRGDDGTNVDADEEDALRDAAAVLAQWGIDDEEQVEAVQDAVKEIVRSGHADIASTASLLGGVVAQEAIKLITKQYIPLEGTAIYDGIKQAIGSFKL